MTTVTKSSLAALALSLFAGAWLPAAAGETDQRPLPLPVCDASTLLDLETHSAG